MPKPKLVGISPLQSRQQWQLPTIKLTWAWADFRSARGVLFQCVGPLTIGAALRTKTEDSRNLKIGNGRPYPEIYSTWECLPHHNSSITLRLCSTLPLTGMKPCRHHVTKFCHVIIVVTWAVAFPVAGCPIFFPPYLLMEFKFVCAWECFEAEWLALFWFLSFNAYT